MTGAPATPSGRREPDPQAVPSLRASVPSAVSGQCERIAKIIDPDAWHDTLPQDGCAPYWMKRRNDARMKAQTIIKNVALL